MVDDKREPTCNNSDTDGNHEVCPRVVGLDLNKAADDGWLGTGSDQNHGNLLCLAAVQKPGISVDLLQLSAR